VERWPWCTGDRVYNTWPVATITAACCNDNSGY